MTEVGTPAAAVVDIRTRRPYAQPPVLPADELLDIFVPRAREKMLESLMMLTLGGRVDIALQTVEKLKGLRSQLGFPPLSGEG